jgi:hypothetical protein
MKILTTKHTEAKQPQLPVWVCPGCGETTVRVTSELDMPHGYRDHVRCNGCSCDLGVVDHRDAEAINLAVYRSRADEEVA